MPGYEQEDGIGSFASFALHPIQMERMGRSTSESQYDLL